MKTRPQSWRDMSAAPRFFIAVVVICGTAVLTYSILHGKSENPLKFVCYLVIALAASRLKVNLPGITGTMSVNFLFLLLGVLELSLSEAMALGCAAVVVQCFDRDRPVPIQVAFNVCHIQVGVNFFVTTKDFAGNTVQTMQNAGIIINATPTVYSQDSVDFVALNLDLTNSSLAGNATTGTIINTEQATTKVLLLNGEQTTIGGLYSTTESSHREGIPVLKDLPWWVLGIRYLTGSETMTTQTKELIILIKADILPTLMERFEALKTESSKAQKTMQDRLREYESHIKQLDPTIGK